MPRPGHRRTRGRRIILLAIVAVVLVVVTVLLRLRGQGGACPPLSRAGQNDEPWVNLRATTNTPVQLADMVVHRRDASGRIIKVLFVALTSNVNPVTCSHLVSAYLSGVPVVLGGYKTPFHFHAKMNFTLDAARAAGLSDHDVVMYMDRDTLFTGTNPWDFIDRFISSSPANQSQLDASAIRQGKGVAPLMWSSEEFCSSWHTFGTDATCKNVWSSIRQVYTDEYIPSSKKRLHRSYDADRFRVEKFSTQYINSGIALARVWAMREVNDALQLASSRSRSIREHIDINCDQSIVHLLYTDLMHFELRSDVLAGGDQLRHMTSQFGLHAGVMDFDYLQEMGTIGELSSLLELNARSWEIPGTLRLSKDYAQLSVQERTSCSSQKTIATFFRQLRVPATPMPLTQRKVELFDSVWNVHAAKPLLGRRPEQNGNREVFPILIHLSAPDKENRLSYLNPFMNWAIPILYSRESRAKALKMLQSMPIVSHSSSSGTTYVENFVDLCPAPFRDWEVHP